MTLMRLRPYVRGTVRVSRRQVKVYLLAPNRRLAVSGAKFLKPLGRRRTYRNPYSVKAVGRGGSVRACRFGLEIAYIVKFNRR